MPISQQKEFWTNSFKSTFLSNVWFGRDAVNYTKGSKSYKRSFLFFLQNLKLSYIKHWMYEDYTFCKHTENTFFFQDSESLEIKKFLMVKWIHKLFHFVV